MIDPQATNFIRTLQNDLVIAKKELAKIESRQAVMTHKVEYIEVLLRALGVEVEEDSGKYLSPSKDTNDSLLLHEGLSISEAAIEILRAAKEPISCMEIARRAIARNYGNPNIERARSHFSAVISKDIRGTDPTFCQMGRGRIGLIEWNLDENGLPPIPK